MFVNDQKTAFLPGETTHAHYQIEMNCSACHTPMMGVKQDACLSCHEDELKEMRDSHPENKFSDPRNFDMIQKLDARKCVECHKEHSPHTTDSFGVSLPQDYCKHCHEEIGNETLFVSMNSIPSGADMNSIYSFTKEPGRNF